MSTRFFRSWRGWLWFGAAFGLLLFTLYASFAFRGVAAWSVGLVYIVYDSTLLLFMVGSSSRAVALARRAEIEAGGGAASAGTARPTLTVVICARNERLVLPTCLAALARQSEPAEEVVVVDDGSTDGMAEWLERAYDLRASGSPAPPTIPKLPGLRLLRKANTGKADSLNFGWRLGTGEIIVTLDADTVIEPLALAALRDAFVADPTLGIADSVLTPVCRPGPLAGLFQFYQTFEYARGYLWRLTWMHYGMLLLVSGAFAAYRRTVLEAAGGFDRTSWVEDYELTHRVYRDAARSGHRVTVKTLAQARGTTDAPAGLRAFLNQRRRWFGGFIATHFAYHEMVGNPRYGRIGRYMLCLKTLDLLLPIYALAAAVVLVVVLATRHRLDSFVLGLVAAKLLFDLGLHASAVALYQRWQGTSGAGRLWPRSLVATLTEPFAFQLLRQLGAVLGWLAFLSQRIDWQPQRPKLSPGH